MEKDNGGEHYRCSSCKQTITVYVKAAVRCSRCGKAMRRYTPEETE